jgi:hypothetical protein
VYAASNFLLNFQGNMTLVTGAPSVDTNEIAIRLRWPTQTDWLDLNAQFIEGNWAAGDGCWHPSLGNTKEETVHILGATIGTRSSINSFNKCYIELTIPQGWTGFLTSITVTWGAI